MPACQLFCRAMQKIGASSEFCAHALNSALFSVILNLVVRIRISFRGSVFPESFCVGSSTASATATVATELPTPGGTYSRHGGAAEQRTRAPTAAHGAATPSSTGARSRPGFPKWEILGARGQSPAPRPRGCGSVASPPPRCARDRRQYLHRATM